MGNQNLKNTQTVILDNFVGSYYKGNYIWSLAMNLAWQELSESIIQEKIKLNSINEETIKMTDVFNKFIVSEKDLDKGSYYIKSGYGQETVDAINKEVKNKFPNKNFPSLKLKLFPLDIISYAYFLKSVIYEQPMSSTIVDFLGKEVEGFSADDETQKESIFIISYDSDDKFIVSIKLKDNDDELIFAKGYDMKKPQAVLNYIVNSRSKETLKECDFFEAPIIHLSYNRIYSELEGNYLLNKKFTEFKIKQMFENIKFDIDEKGARVENEAVLFVEYGCAPPSEEESSRCFILDKPYWVIMKRQASQKPYFMLGVNNTELMQELDNFTTLL